MKYFEYLSIDWGSFVYNLFILCGIRSFYETKTVQPTITFQCNIYESK